MGRGRARVTCPVMDNDVLRHLFEQLYSTKGNRGNGLGLYISYDNVKRHDGSLMVKSRVGVRCEFDCGNLLDWASYKSLTAKTPLSLQGTSLTPHRSGANRKNNYSTRPGLFGRSLSLGLVRCTVIGESAPWASLELDAFCRRGLSKRQPYNSVLPQSSNALVGRIASFCAVRAFRGGEHLIMSANDRNYAKVHFLWSSREGMGS